MDNFSSWSLLLNLAYLQNKALCQLVWVQHTVNKAWITAVVWIERLKPLMSGPTRNKVSWTLLY